MRIAIHAFDGVTMFHLASPEMVFGTVRRLGLADWQPFLFAAAPGSVHTAEGYELTGLSGPTSAMTADVVVIHSWYDDARPAGDAVVDVLRQAHARDATILGLCLGAFPVADAGLLDGRRAVTHWRAMPDFARLHPEILADESALYVDHGDVLTSAGTASAIDACLHLVRSRLGARAANSVARTMVVAPHREGGQAQYIERPLPNDPDDDAVARLMEWAGAHLDEDLPAQRLADVAHLSVRTLVRRFRAATGSTPAAWVRSRRVDAARTCWRAVPCRLSAWLRRAGSAASSPCVRPSSRRPAPVRPPTAVASGQARQPCPPAYRAPPISGAQIVVRH